VEQRRRTWRGADKHELRRMIRSRRAGRDGSAAGFTAGYRALVRDRLAGSPLTVAGFLPLPGEPDVTVCLGLAAEAGHRTLAPRTAPAAELDWIGWRPGRPTVADRHGLRAPDGPAVPLVVPDRSTLLLVPALAVDAAGHRLGQGGGYYDRLLAGLRRWPDGPLRVAVVHADEVLPAVPVDPHDEQVDVLLVPGRWSAAR
jgi:5-formyltetrahydrofolate cyclo-ligase